MMETLYNLGYKITGLGLEWAAKNCRQPKILFEKLVVSPQENHALILATSLVQTLSELRNADEKILSLEREIKNLEGQNQRLFDLVSLHTLLGAKAAGFSPPSPLAESVGLFTHTLAKTIESALPSAGNPLPPYSAENSSNSAESLGRNGFSLPSLRKEAKPEIFPAATAAADFAGSKPRFVKKPRCKAQSGREARDIGFPKPRDVRSASLRMRNATARNSADGSAPSPTAEPRRASEPANRRVKGTEHEKPHRRPACESSPPATSRSRDSRAVTPSSDNASPCRRSQPRAGRNRDTSRCNPKGRSREKAANFKQQKAANPAASAENTREKQHKESHEIASHGRKRVRFRDTSPAAPESGSQRSQRDRKKRRTRKIHDPDSSDDDVNLAKEIENHCNWFYPPREYCVQKLIALGIPENRVNQMPSLSLKAAILVMFGFQVNRKLLHDQGGGD